jgi:DNA replication protein DnaC
MRPRTVHWVPATAGSTPAESIQQIPARRSPNSPHQLQTSRTRHGREGPKFSSPTAGLRSSPWILEWIGRHENLIACGPSGTGKTFPLEALGQAAVETGKNVAWSTLEQLGALARAHRAGDSVTKAIARILRAGLAVVDDIGLLPAGPDAAEGLYRLADAAYERRSVAVSSNLHPSAFGELMPKTLATATVDRLMHHAHACQTAGDSIRLTQAIAGKGVIPLS